MDYSAFPRHVESSARGLFRRCVQCPDTTPTCPNCGDGQECSFIPASCDACASSKCINSPGSSSNSAPKSSPAGPIAGGVIGGILLVIALVALVYFFHIKKRRQQAWTTQLDDLQKMGEGEKTPSDHRSFAEHRSNRQSQQSVASFQTNKSNSRKSNASNFIQIAYIPGVTSTAAHSPDMVPPVPPIPAAGTTSPHLNTGTEQFFSLTDLRPESTYARSLARSSIAASEYHHDAIVDPMPARAAVTARAVPISVKTNSRIASPTASPPLSHQNSIIGRMNGPMTGQSGQAKQVMITRSASNLTHNHTFEMEDTSPAPTPRIGIDRSGTASPRSMLSDDAASAHRWIGGRSPGSPQPPVSAVRSEFSQSRSSPVSNVGWDSNNIRNTIRDAALQGYAQQPAQQPLTGIQELPGDTRPSHSRDPSGSSAVKTAANPFDNVQFRTHTP